MTHEPGARLRSCLLLSARGVLLTLMGILRPLAAGAQVTEEPAATIVVEAEPLSEAEELAPTSFVSVIDTGAFEGEFETATGALAQAVGVQVRRFGGLGAFSTLSIRGSNANQVRFYLDGIPLTTARRDVVNLANLPLDSLQRIEIYRGTVPIGFGADGIAGVVNMVTRPPVEEPRSEVSAYYGSFNTAKAVASHSQGAGGFDLLASATYLHTDGDFEFLDDNGTDFDPDDDEIATRLNNAVDSVEGLLKVRRSLGESLEIDVTSDNFYSDQGVPSTGSNQSLQSSQTALRSVNYVRGRSRALSEDLDLNGAFYGIYERDTFTDLERKLFGIGIDNEESTTSIGANLLATYFAGEMHKPSGFAEIAFQRFTSEDALRMPQELPAQERLDLDAALQDEVGLFGGRLLILPVLRYEHLEDTITGQFSPAGEPVGGRVTKARDLWSPSIGAEISPWPWLAVKGNLGLYQRAPSFAELFGSRGFVRGNPKLVPEKAVNRDVGFVLTGGALGWLDEGRVECVYFNNDVDDLITLVQTSQSFFTYQNFGSARLRGLELSVHSAWLEHLALDVNYTHQEAENLTPTRAGNDLPLRPQDEVYGRLELRAERGKIYYEVSYVGANFVDPANFDEVEGRATQNVGLVVKALPWLSLGFEVANITDNEVRDILDFPLPGRSFIGNVTARF